jgi:hypothetical protein
MYFEGSISTLLRIKAVDEFIVASTWFFSPGSFLTGELRGSLAIAGAEVYSVCIFQSKRHRLSLLTLRISTERLLFRGDNPSEGSLIFHCLV